MCMEKRVTFVARESDKREKKGKLVKIGLISLSLISQNETLVDRNFEI